MKNTTLILLIFTALFGCSSTHKTQPIKISNNNGCATKSSYKLDVDNDGLKEKLIFSLDAEKKRVRAHVYFSSKVVEVSFLNGPRYSDVAKYEYVVKNDPKSEGFYFSTSCHTDHMEYYKYQKGKFEVITFEEP